MGKGGPKVQTCSYKINKSWEYNVQHGNMVDNIVCVYLKDSKRVELKSSHHMKKKVIICGDGCKLDLMR